VWPLTALGFEPKFIIPDSAQTVGVVFANCFAGSFLSDYFWYVGFFHFLFFIDTNFGYNLLLKIGL
jgi:hypothetical protein